MMTTKNLNRKRNIAGWACLLFACTLSAETIILPDLTPSGMDPQSAFTFALFGDTHYASPAFGVSPALRQAAKEIQREGAPAFVAHTGDLVNGEVPRSAGNSTGHRLAGSRQMEQEHTFALKDFTCAFPDIPFFLAIGNHDRHDPKPRALERIIWPAVEKFLGTPIVRDTYAFQYGCACFIFVDYAAADFTAQARWVSQVLRIAEERKLSRRFILGHLPLFCVARAGFSNSSFMNSLLPLMEQYKVDAYLCGHTHNASVCVRSWDGHCVTQIQNISMDTGKKLVPFGQSRSFILPANERLYCWGFAEGMPMAYSLVTVSPQHVNVRWNVSGYGTCRTYTWKERNRVVETGKSFLPPVPALRDEQFKQLKRVALLVCPAAEEDLSFRVSLNGVNLGDVSIRSVPWFNTFWKTQRLVLPQKAVSLLRRCNTVTIENPNKKIFSLSNVQLEAVLENGVSICTPVHQGFFFSSLPPDPPCHRPSPRESAPSDVLQAVSLGDPLPEIRLSFPSN